VRDGPEDRLAAAAHARLAVGAADVGLHGVEGDLHLLGDLVVALAGGDVGEGLPLARGEQVGLGRGPELLGRQDRQEGRHDHLAEVDGAQRAPELLGPEALGEVAADPVPELVGQPGLVVPRVDRHAPDERVGRCALQGLVAARRPEGLDEGDVDRTALPVLDAAELEAAERPEHAVEAAPHELVAAEKRDTDVHAGQLVVLRSSPEERTSPLDDPPTVTRDSRRRGPRRASTVVPARPISPPRVNLSLALDTP